ncbi:MAG: hypothetical protein GXO42_01675 [bacterium]|nr:hypothetical protein [bacterium]
MNNIIYNRLKHGLLQQDRQQKEELEKIILQLEQQPFFIRPCKLYEYLKAKKKRTKEDDLFLLAFTTLLIYYLLKVVPLSFDEVFLAAEEFLRDKICYKKDKHLLAQELAKLYAEQLLLSLPEKYRKIVELLAKHQGELKEEDFVQVLGLSKKEYFKLLEELEALKIAKWTTGFRVRLDVYGRIIAKLLSLQPSS